MDEEQMRRVIDEAFPPEERKRQQRDLQKRTNVVGKLDQDKVLQAFKDAGYTYIREKPAKKTDLAGKVVERGDMYVMNDCPLVPNETHGGGPAIYFWENGDSGFSCRGGRCQEDPKPTIFDAIAAIGVDPSALFVEEDETAEAPEKSTESSPMATTPRTIEIQRLRFGEPKPERPPYLLDPIFPRGAIIAPVGLRGSSKTYFCRVSAVQLAAAGIRVFYASEDSSRDLDETFMARMLAGMEMTSPPDALFWAQRQGVNLSNRTFRDAFIAKVKDHGSEIVFLDTFTRLYAGHLADRRESWDIAAAFSSMLTDMQAETGACLVPIFHPPAGKPESLPGGSALEGAVDEVVVFKGNYTGGLESHFVMKTAKGTRYQNYRYRGTILGEEDGESPLNMYLETIGGQGYPPFIVKSGEPLVGGAEWKGSERPSSTAGSRARGRSSGSPTATAASSATSGTNPSTPTPSRPFR